MINKQKRTLSQVWHFIWYHTIVVLRGFIKVLYGAAVAGLIGLAVYGFTAIPTEGGYAAVCDFILAAATMAVAICCTYAFGSKAKKKGRYSANG